MVWLVVNNYIGYYILKYSWQKEQFILISLDRISSLRVPGHIYELIFTIILMHFWDDISILLTLTIGENVNRTTIITVKQQ